MPCHLPSPIAMFVGNGACVSLLVWVEAFNFVVVFGVHLGIKFCEHGSQRTRKRRAPRC